MVITRREKNLIFILILLVLGFIFMRFSYLPRQQQIETLNTKQQQLLEEKALLNAQKQTPEFLASQKAKLEAQQLTLAAQVPAQPELTELLRFIQATCYDAGVPLLDLTYEQKDSSKPELPGQINCRLGTTGSVHDLTSLLQNITAGPRLIKINQATGTAKQKPPPEPELEPDSEPTETGEQIVSKYYIPPPEIPVSLGQRLPVSAKETVPEPKAASKPETTPPPEQKKADQIIKGVFDLDLQITAYYLNEQSTATDKTHADAGEKQ